MAHDASRCGETLAIARHTRRRALTGELQLQGQLQFSRIVPGGVRCSSWLTEVRSALILKILEIEVQPLRTSR
jgi:hypothetical protein